MNEREPMSFNRALGLNVARFRRAAGLSQTDLAGLLAERGLPFQQPTVLKVEKGTRPLKAEELHAVSEVLGVSMKALVHYTGDSEVAMTLAQLRTAQRTYQDLVEEAKAMMGAVDKAGRYYASSLQAVVDAYVREGEPEGAEPYRQDLNAYEADRLATALDNGEVVF